MLWLTDVMPEQAKHNATGIPVDILAPKTE